MRIFLCISSRIGIFNTHQVLKVIITDHASRKVHLVPGDSTIVPLLASVILVGSLYVKKAMESKTEIAERIIDILPNFHYLNSSSMTCSMQNI